jgi:hypothetical protein
MTLYLTVLLCFGLFRGIHEGMNHIQFTDPMHNDTYQEGVRGHVWHSRYYHKIALFRDLFALLFGYLVISMPFNILLFTGTLLIIWETTETAYSIARYGEVIDYENINFADFFTVKIQGIKVAVLHIGRAVLAMTLIMLGGIT